MSIFCHSLENLIDFLLNERKVFVFRFLKIVDKKREIRERVFVGMKKKPRDNMKDNITTIGH